MEAILVDFGKALAKFLVVGASDWRIYFIHLGCWATVHYIKAFWDGLPPFKRRRLTEVVSIAIAGGLTAWVYKPGDMYYGQLIFFMAVANPSLYKLAVNGLSRYESTKWIVKTLKPKKYYLSTERTSEGVEEDTVLAIREDGEKTIVLTKKDLAHFRKKL